MKVLVGAFNQEKARVGAFSVIVKSSWTLVEPSFQALVCWDWADLSTGVLTMLCWILAWAARMRWCSSPSSVIMPPHWLHYWLPADMWCPKLTVTEYKHPNPSTTIHQNRFSLFPPKHLPQVSGCSDGGTRHHPLRLAVSVPELTGHHNNSLSPKIWLCFDEKM